MLKPHFETFFSALKSIEEAYSKRKDWPSIQEKISKKAIIYTILDQDATYKKYIGVHWPSIRVFYNSNQFWCMAYPWKRDVPKPFQRYFEGSFMGPLIHENGPLLAKYYSYGDGQVQKGDDQAIFGEHVHRDLSRVKPAGLYQKYDFISEGDTPHDLPILPT